MRRTLQSIPLLLLISIILYTITTNAPGGALAPYLQNPHITPADIVRLKHNLGMDLPPPIQYLKWLWHVVSSGDLGWSTSNSEPVVQAILDRIPATFELTISAFVLALSLGLSAGLFSAIKPYSIWDYFITTFAFFGQSMPVFWFALMLQLALAVHGIPLPGGYEIKLPSAGWASGDVVASWNPFVLFGDFFAHFGDRVSHLILPTIVLALLQLALFSRFMRSSMLEVMKTDYMRTAQAKGLDFKTVVMKHGFKNALIPVVTVVALSLPGIAGGAIITETIFAWPGTGRLFFNALQQSDISLLMGYLMMIATLVVFFNLFADVAYAWLDPRVKYD